MRRAKDHLVITDDSNGDLSRTNSSGFSSMADVAERDTSCVSCTTFNILTPIYKRLDPQNQRLRGSDFRSLWLARNQKILDWLLYESPSIMCFQEFWVGNAELVQMYEETWECRVPSFKACSTIVAMVFSQLYARNIQEL